MNMSKQRRTARIERATSESRVTLRLDLDGTGQSAISTGVGFYDHMLTALAKHSLIDLDVRPPATGTSTPTTPSRTPRSCSARLCGPRSATRRASAGSAMPWCRWTRRWPRRWSTYPAGRTASTPASRKGQQYVLIGGGVPSERAVHRLADPARAGDTGLPRPPVPARHAAGRPDPHHIVECQFKAVARALRDRHRPGSAGEGPCRAPKAACEAPSRALSPPNAP